MKRGFMKIYQLFADGNPLGDEIFNQALIALLVIAAMIGTAVIIVRCRRNASRKLAEEIMEECGADEDRVG